MTRVTWRDYQIGDEYHLECWRTPPVGSHDWHTFQKGLRLNRGFTFTFVDEDGRVLGIGGLIFHNKGNAEAWNMLNDEALSMPALPRAVRSLLHELQEKYQIERMWSTGDPGELERLSRWFKFLGMHHEGLIEAWGPDGRDQHFFARIRKEAL